MNLTTFARLARGQSTPCSGARRTFRQGVMETAPAAPLSPAQRAELTGTTKPAIRAKAKAARAFLEGRGPLPASLKRKRLTETDADHAGFMARMAAARAKGKREAPHKAYATSAREACLAILDDESLSWEERLEKVSEIILGVAKLKDEGDDDAKGAVADRLREWWTPREYTAKDRRARKGAGVKRDGRHHLLEAFGQDGVEVGGDSVARGVKILGPSSKNRRKYTLQCMQEAVSKYEGIGVFIDHPLRPTDPRSARDRFGELQNVRVEGNCLVGDLHFNPEHEWAPTFLWFAKNQPGQIGLSHNSSGRGFTDGQGFFVVEHLENVRSVDVVSTPASTDGLFA